MTTPRIEAAARAILSNDGWKEKAIDKMRDEQHVEWKEAVTIAFIVWNLVALPAEPVVNWEDAEDPVVRLFVQYPVDEYVGEYEYGEDGNYTPSEHERDMITGAIYGVLADLHEKLRAIIPSAAPAVERDSALEEAAKIADAYEKRAAGYRGPDDFDALMVEHAQAAEEIAASIRALKSASQEGK